MADTDNLIRQVWQWAKTMLATVSFPANVADQTTLLAVQDTVDDRLNEHFHHSQEIAPLGATPAALFAGAGAYNWGAFVELLAAADAPAALFDLHWAIISNPDTNGDYEIEFVYGPGDTHACYCGFARSAASVEIVPMPLMTPQLPAGSRIRARCRHSVGGGGPTVRVARLFYHQY